MSEVASFPKLAYKIYPELNVFLVKSSAIISFEDLIIHVGNLMDDNQFYTGINACYDFSMLEQLEGNIKAFRSTAEAMNDHNLIDKPARTAILVADNSLEINKIFQEYALMTSKSLIDYRVFTTSEISSLLKFLNLSKLPQC